MNIIEIQKETDSLTAALGKKLIKDIFNITDDSYVATIKESEVCISCTHNSYHFMIKDEKVLKLNREKTLNFFPHDNSAQVQHIRFDMKDEFERVILPKEEEIIIWIEKHVIQMNIDESMKKRLLNEWT